MPILPQESEAMVVNRKVADKSDAVLKFMTKAEREKAALERLEAKRKAMEEARNNTSRSSRHDFSRDEDRVGDRDRSGRDRERLLLSHSLTSCIPC